MIPLASDIKVCPVRVSENRKKLNYIIYLLYEYGADDVRDAVRIIEEHGMDKFDFDYPYGSFEEFKKHTFAGEFDVEDTEITDEERAEWDRALKAGEVKVIHEDHKNCMAWVKSYPKKGDTCDFSR